MEIFESLIWGVGVQRDFFFWFNQGTGADKKTGSRSWIRPKLKMVFRDTKDFARRFSCAINPRPYYT